MEPAQPHRSSESTPPGWDEAAWRVLGSCDRVLLEALARPHGSLGAALDGVVGLATGLIGERCTLEVADGGSGGAPHVVLRPAARAATPKEEGFLDELAERMMLALSAHARILRSTSWGSDEQAGRGLPEASPLAAMLSRAVAHDLRNPLSAAITGVQLAQRLTHEPTAQRALARVFQSTQRLARMIDQLSDYARLSVGEGLPLGLGEVELATLTQRVLAELPGAESGVQLAVVGDVKGRWDGERLAEVLACLVGNALVHGRGGVRLQLDGRAAEEVVVRVSNTGEVRPDVLAAIFEPRRRGRSSELARGLGFGLYVAHAVVVAHGGRLIARSAHGRTEVTVSLPRRAG